MIQGGGFNQDMEEQESSDSIKNEAKTGGANKRGTLAMARTNEPHSASSQFFINVGDNDFLDFKSETEQGFGYCVFGKVVEGMEVVDAIKEVKTGQSGFHGDVPVDAIIIESMAVLETA
jgi:peptidyl-prolyl cis-trans isomerase B (cyclophilin B)